MRLKEIAIKSFSHFILLLHLLLENDRKWEKKVGDANGFMNFIDGDGSVTQLKLKFVANEYFHEVHEKCSDVERISKRNSLLIAAYLGKQANS
ncbi:CLUMA_CG002290, isoform A [Clunio marinus]|uniref:CLUMA_CG002290, isoform A n=1 Tax=Clunio marinus TaxID=568069 RepID=A0A1J1HLZ0_9DIPT|nr:CLUMA_CG002290, isoform A [Clunio marinus]